MNVMATGRASGFLSDAACLARARTLRPAIEAASPGIEALRALPPELLAALHDAAIFRTLLPRSCGGAEVHPATFVEIAEAVAMGDGSAAWCVGQGSGCSMTAAYLAPEAAREIFGPPDAVLAWGFGPNGVAVPCEGGYRVTGKWSFASGSRHATWLGGHSHVLRADGDPERDGDGKPIERTMLFPRGAATIIDDWQVMGLRGTGSDSYRVTDLFVPAAHSASRDRDVDRRERGTLYKLSSQNLYSLGFAGVALGLARAMLDAFIALAREKTPQSLSLPLCENPAVQSELGRAEARLRAARVQLLAVARDVYASLEPEGARITLDQRIAIRMATTFAIHEARDVSEFVWQEAGSTAIFEKNPFERRFRDLHAVTQQAQGRSHHLQTVGAHILGQPVSGRFL